MTKYQLADLVNGSFGDIYDTQPEAEAAMDDLVAELMDTAKEEVKLEEEGSAASNYRDPKLFTDEELAVLAERRIRDFHSIEEVEVDE